MNGLPSQFRRIAYRKPAAEQIAELSGSHLVLETSQANNAKPAKMVPSIAIGADPSSSRLRLYLVTPGFARTTDLEYLKLVQIRPLENSDEGMMDGQTFEDCLLKNERSIRRSRSICLCWSPMLALFYLVIASVSTAQNVVAIDSHRK